MPNDSGLDELHVESDGDLVADQKATGLERRIPGETKVFAVDLRRSRQSQAGVAPGNSGRGSRSLYMENRVAGDAMNREVASYGQFSLGNAGYARRLECQSRELLYVQEVRTLQVCVPLEIARVDGRSIDRDFDSRVDEIGAVH